MKKRTTDRQARLQPLRREAAPTPEDAPLATLFANVEPLDPLPEISAQRIRRRLDQELGRSSRSGLPSWLRSALAGGAALLFLEAVAAAAIAGWPAARHRLFGGIGKTLPANPAPVPAPSPAPSNAPGAPLANPMPMLVPAIPARPPSPRPRSRVSVATPSAPSPTTPSAAEDPDVALYTQALSQLNAQRDPVAALGTLRAYRFQHPNGLFRNEAAIAEIRAELILGRETEALSLLDAMHARSFAGVPQASELALLRAELLGRADRCDEALPALAPYLEGGTPAGERERALYARAACRAQLGDTEGSQTDLRTYLSEFPHGRFAAKVRAQLGRP
jgi:hypothetical protein